MKLQEPGYLQEITPEPLGTSMNGSGSAHSYEEQRRAKELLGLVDSNRHGRATPSDNPFRDDKSRRMLIEANNKDLRIN